MVRDMFRCQFEAIPSMLSNYDDDTIRAVLADMKKAQTELARMLMNRAEVRMRHDAKRIDGYVTDLQRFNDPYEWGE
jgi:hypothetical protein